MYDYDVTNDIQNQSFRLENILLCLDIFILLSSYQTLLDFRISKVLYLFTFTTATPNICKNARHYEKGNVIRKKMYIHYIHNYLIIN